MQNFWLNRVMVWGVTMGIGGLVAVPVLADEVFPQEPASEFLTHEHYWGIGAGGEFQMFRTNETELGEREPRIQALMEIGQRFWDISFLLTVGKTVQQEGPGLTFYEFSAKPRGQYYLKPFPDPIPNLHIAPGIGPTITYGYISSSGSRLHTIELGAHGGLWMKYMLRGRTTVGFAPFVVDLMFWRNYWLKTQVGNRSRSVSGLRFVYSTAVTVGVMF